MSEKRSVRVEPNTPYVLMGFHLIDILVALKSMPRSTETICLQIEDIMSNAQVLQDPADQGTGTPPPNT